MKSKLLAAFALATSTTIALPATAAEPTYRTNIAPLLHKYCSECHGADAPSLAEFLLNEAKYKEEKSGPKLNTYADVMQLIGWPDTGAMMRRLDDGTNTADKKPGNMYKHLGDTEAERAANLALIKAWIGEDAWNLNRWAKRGDIPAITKEQMDKLKVKY